MRKLIRKGDVVTQVHADVKALSGSELLANPNNQMLDGSLKDNTYGFDSWDDKAPDITVDDVDGNAGFKGVSPAGDNRAARTTKPKKGDPTPGGGW